MLIEIGEERSEDEVRGILPIIFEKGLKTGGTKEEDLSALRPLLSSRYYFEVSPGRAGTDIALHSLTTDFIDEGEIDHPAAEGA